MRIAKGRLKNFDSSRQENHSFSWEGDKIDTVIFVSSGHCTIDILVRQFGIQLFSREFCFVFREEMGSEPETKDFHSMNCRNF